MCIESLASSCLTLATFYIGKICTLYQVWFILLSHNLPHALTLATHSYVLLGQPSESDEVRCRLKSSLDSGSLVPRLSCTLEPGNETWTVDDSTLALFIHTLCITSLYCLFTFHCMHTVYLDRFGFARHQSAASYKGHPSTIL